MCSFQRLLQKANDLYKQNIPFVLYKTPNSKKVRLGYCSKNTPEKYAPVFVFAPFENRQKRIEIPLENILEAAVKFENGNHIATNLTTPQNEPLEKEAHINLVKKTVDFIKKGRAKKVVIASEKKVSTAKTFTEIFERLVNNHQSAFTYVFFHIKTGIWMGATPELLIEKKGDNFKTVALAGTKPYKNNENIWEAKEIEEQKMVVESIVTALEKEKITLKIDACKTVRAGHLAHLFTKIKGQTNTKNIFQLIDLLHPTAAVCGLPTAQAYNFIVENEKIQRSFYTGFLGVIDREKSESAIFVNLRCLQLKNNTATIFAGGGITAKSDPEKEWEEILLKRKTMLKHL